MTERQRFFFVTGCDSGFGKIITELLSEDERNVVYAGCYLEKSMDELKRGLGENVVPVLLDVTSDESVAKATERIRNHIGSDRGLDGLVNNAGILVTPGPVEWTPISAYRRMLDVNLIGMARVTKAVLPLLRRGRGRIVNIASIAGRVGLPTQSAYCASKYAVEGYSEVLRKEMLPWGVTVHVIEPGVFKQTGLYGTWKKGYEANYDDLPEDVKRDYGRTFYKRTWEGMSKTLDLPIGNNDPASVPRAMLHALTSESPKYRYRVGNDSKYIITPLTWTSEATQDWVLASGKNVPEAAPRDGRNAALRRYETNYFSYYVAAAAALAYWVIRRGSRL